MHLVIADGASLTASTGITLENDNQLHIYGQTAGTGTINATGSFHQAGIGGDIHNTGGTLVVNGGVINAQGGEEAAGIGGGGYNAVSSSGILPGNGGVAIFNGGYVTAKGGEYGGYGVGAGRTPHFVGEPTALTLNWTTGNETYFIESAEATVDLQAPFVFQSSGEEVTDGNYTGETIVPNTNIHIVTFRVDGNIYMQQKVVDGHTVTAPPAPSVQGKHFLGWLWGISAYDFSKTGFQ